MSTIGSIDGVPAPPGWHALVGGEFRPLLEYRDGKVTDEPRKGDHGQPLWRTSVTVSGPGIAQGSASLIVESPTLPDPMESEYVPVPPHAKLTIRSARKDEYGLVVSFVVPPEQLPAWRGQAVANVKAA